MRISTKGRYALRLMLDIAMNDAEGKPVRVKDIAKRQEVSGKYLEQIVSVLTKAGWSRFLVWKKEAKFAKEWKNV